MSEMDSLVQNECVVTGTLGLVLRVSRIAGLAPLRFKKTRGGWIVRVSPAAHVYGQILAAVLTLLVTLSVIIVEWPRVESSGLVSSRVIVWFAELAFSVMVVTVAAFTGLRRMRCLIHCMAQLQKVNFKLRVNPETRTSERIRMLIFVGHLALTTFTMGVHHYVNRALLHDIGLNIFMVAKILIIEIIVVQFCQITMSVLISLKMLNKYLKNLLQETVYNTSPSNSNQNTTDHVKHLSINRVSLNAINGIIDTMAIGTPEASQSISARVRQVSSLFCSIGDVVRDVNHSHGTLLITVLLCLLQVLVVTFYQVIMYLVKQTTLNPYLQAIWVVIHLSKMLMIIEPCHRTHTEMKLTKQLISQMIRFSPPEHRALMSELELFYPQLILCNVTYSPLAMFTLNRPFIVAILGSITTYLVIVIQY